MKQPQAREGRRRGRPVHATAPAVETASAGQVALVLLLVTAAGVVRLFAARGEIWLDEIWSFRLGQLVPVVSGVFTGIHHDNNHHLNTIYLQFVPHTSHWITYRLHAILAGAGSAAAAWWVARRAGPWGSIAACALVSGSFLLVLYGSEARGYSLAVLFALLSVVLAARHLEVRSVARALAFGVTAVLGLLSHLTYLHAYAGVFVWSVYRMRKLHKLQAGGLFVAAARLHAVPLLALAALYLVDLRHVVVGGGPVMPASEVVSRAVSLAVGGPDDGPLRGAVLVLCGILWLASMVVIRRSGSDLWVLFGVTTLGAPLFTLAVLPSDLLFERYFLVALAFMLVAFGWTVAALARSHAGIAVFVVAAFLVLNGVRVAALIERGRASYVPALEHMISRATQRPVTIGGDHDFRHGRSVEFLLPLVAGGEGAEFHLRDEWAAAGPEWMLVHSVDAHFAPPARMTAAGGREYRLSAVHRSIAVSGWHLAVYHNALAPEPR